jgi:cysteine desulfurase
MIYLDANATEPPRPEARAAMLAALDLPGNPASIHGPGRQARHLLETARTTIAVAFNAAAADLVFCSGGTEANAMAIAGLSPGRRILYGATEHDAVRAACAGGEALPVDSDGTLNLEALEAALKRGGAALVCVMLANNETGVVTPMAPIATLCRAHGARLHVDAVQAAGRIPLDAAALDADTVAISAHKLGGPKGAGALLLHPGLAFPALIAGGGQEKFRRGGTQALPAIAGFAAAVEAAVASMQRTASHLASLRDRLEQAAIDLGARVCGAGPRLPNTTCLALPGAKAETQVIALDLAGVAVSAGAACSSGKVARSHVLEAMGLHELAGCAIRVSLPWSATDQDIDGFLAAYAAVAARLGGRMAAAE